jgi:uncharacterized membrane protein YdjX (TVP38/TMEM64 family)
VKGRRVVVGLGLVLGLAVAYWLLRDSGAITTVLDAQALKAYVTALGVWGPVAVIALMVLAILVSPIPSAPIALAAGAAYGHTWGALFVLTGAELGALAAFGIARLVGHDVLRHWFGDRLALGWLGSQTALMGLVFASRLLPFVSFDVISYAAGLTVLSFWRYAVATLAGIAPASFLLAHFGDEMATAEDDRILLAAAGLGLLVALPLVAKAVRDRLRQRRSSGTDVRPPGSRSDTPRPDGSKPPSGL